ncbi:MAG: PIG-L family deacetylase [Verrucomicrobiales bacterium]|nr:PIG-L family deacetylase [Verrucomicrobiales bacterium]
MKALFLHAHFDDYEFTAAGTFELWRRALGAAFQARVVICTDGRAGHHRLTREETWRVRWQEQQESAALGGYECEVLRLPDGAVPREACLRVTVDLLAALWKAIRDFEPDYLFCPPLPADPLAGMHVDHAAIAQAVREVAYMINVPHAFTPEYPADETRSRPCRVPVIIATYDTYMSGANAFDLVVDVEPAMDLITRMSWSHQSQIREWLPWVGRHEMEAPEDLEAWSRTLRARKERENRELGLPERPATEVFTVTGWGERPDVDRLRRDFPGLVRDEQREARLRRRFARG